MHDELNEPLGRNTPQRSAPRNPISRRAGWSAAGVLLIAGVSALALVPRDPYGGQPHAIARIEPAKPLPAAPPPVENSDAPGQDRPPGSATAQGVASANDIEMRSGVKVTRTGSPDAPGALIIQVDQGSGVRLPPAPDPRIAEKGRYGLLPKIGADGLKPMQVYSRPFVTSAGLKPGAPRIAIVVGGLGLSAALTSSAIDELPEAVTLAFAPYGANLESFAARARDRGHEILLQAPMEPFDYPGNNPGPHTLLTDAADSLDDLRWLLSRFPGYAGVMNFLGARFTADEKALSPTLAELGQRGLFFLDDGTSPQSLAITVAQKVSLPAARVDVALDAGRTAQALEAALTQLEAQARQSGVAIGFANAGPATTARIARFARDLERKGVALAPVTAILEQSRDAEANRERQSREWDISHILIERDKPAAQTRPAAGAKSEAKK